MQGKTGPDFARFLATASPGFRSFNDIDILQPAFDHEGVTALIDAFCGKYYSSKHKRVLVLGINPGRKGGGLTGVPFTDPVALQEFCGIANELHKERELSSTFIYNVIAAFGGPQVFYHQVLLSALCPVGFVKEGKNFNYYDDQKLLKKLEGFLRDSLKFHATLNVRKDVVISLGKENAAHIRRLNDELGLFGNVIVLEHPRFIMQYRRGQMNNFVQKYKNTIQGLG